MGLPADQAARLALATVEGAAALAARAGESPALLADRVASPGGSTRKGLDILDADKRLVGLLRETLEASVARNREMAAAARAGAPVDGSARAGLGPRNDAARGALLHDEV